MPEGWVLTDIGELLTNRDSERVPLSLGVRSKQENKIYDYYGATGVVDKVDGYLFDERLLLIGEDGANLLSRSKDNAFFAEGKYWVNNHAHILDCPEKEVLDYVAFLINSMSLEDYITGSAQPKLNQDNLNKIEIPLPPLEEQRRIIAQVNLWQRCLMELETSENELNESVESAKSKILDLAIHGKLVPQDANDEPASELLKRINPKAVASCDKPPYENVPFVIPSSWAWCKVRDVADVARGGSPRPIKQYLTESPDGVNWIKISDAEEESKYISKTTERIIPDGVKKSRYVKVGDFLLTNSMSFGKPYILGTDGCIHDGWLVISPIDGAYDKNFLYYLLSSSFAYNQFSEKAGGAVVSNLNKDKVADSLFPLPPLAEQKRIASMVEELYSSLEGIASTLQ